MHSSWTASASEPLLADKDFYSSVLGSLRVLRIERLQVGDAFDPLYTLRIQPAPDQHVAGQVGAGSGKLPIVIVSVSIRPRICVATDNNIFRHASSEYRQSQQPVSVAEVQAPLNQS